MEDPELKELIKETAEKHQVILLIAPQGTGKSYYFQNIKAPNSIITPTRALTNQYFNVSVKDKYGRTISLPNTFFQSVEHIQEHIDDTDFLVIDEIHKAVQYSSFAYQQTDSILKAFDSFCASGKPIILTTATPELLKCLKGYSIYDKIDAEIVISTNREYVKEVRIMDDYTESRLKSLVQERYNNNNDSMQILLVNDKNGVERLTKYFQGLSIKAIGITAKNRTNGSEEERVFKDLTQNKPIDYNVLIATSWIDVGINFVNKNITDIYCLFDNEYALGDYTLIWQLMARARNCKPVLYITKPELSIRQSTLINHTGSEMKRFNDDIEAALIKNLYRDVQNEEYTYIFDILCEVAKRGIEDYEKGAAAKDAIHYIDGIYFEGDNEEIARYSEIPIRYFLHRAIEKLNFSYETISKQTNCTIIKNCTQAKGEFSLCTNQEIEEVKKFLIRLVYNKVEFIQKDIKKEISGITNNKVKIGQLKSFIKNSGFNLKLVNHKRTRSVRYLRLFFDMNIKEVHEYCRVSNINLSEIGYVKCTKEELQNIRNFKPDIEVFEDLDNTNNEYVNVK